MVDIDRKKDEESVRTRHPNGIELDTTRLTNCKWFSQPRFVFQMDHSRVQDAEVWPEDWVLRGL